MSDFAAKTRRLFRLIAPDAPGLYFVGAQFDPESFGLGGHPAFSASGKGTDLAHAIGACLSEGAELLSQMVWGDEALRVARPADAASGLDAEALAEFATLLATARAAGEVEFHWIAALRWSDRAAVRVPAALCLRNVEPPDAARPRVKLSSGCGAGPTKERALLHGLLELVERDAVALWWRGGRRGRVLPRPLVEDSAAFLDKLRGGASARVSWLLDISTDLGIPAVAALSADESGRGLVSGFSAHLSYAEAMRAALLEMCQMELGLRVIELKVAQDGEDALGESDRKHRHRARTLDARGCALLHPIANETGRANGFRGAGNPLDWLAGRLGQSGIETYVVDLSRRALGIAVVQALAPRLQPMPSDVVTERLAREISNGGGGFGLTNAIELI